MGFNKKHECIKCNDLFGDHDIVSVRPTSDRYLYFICVNCWVNYYPDEVKRWIKTFPDEKNRFNIVKLKIRQTKIERIKDGIR